MLGQEDQQAAFIIPLFLFTAENSGSLREPPTLDVAAKLLWNYCQNGFVSHDEPVLVRLQDRIIVS